MYGRNTNVWQEYTLVHPRGLSMLTLTMPQGYGCNEGLDRVQGRLPQHDGAGAAELRGVELGHDSGQSSQLAGALGGSQ